MPEAKKLSRRELFGGGREPALTIASSCIARLGVVCQSCGDACPEAAIRFPPRLGAPPVPVLKSSACTLCGECVAACPAGAISIREAGALPHA